jgi:hypothetical protein
MPTTENDRHADWGERGIYAAAPDWALNEPFTGVRDAVANILHAAARMGIDPEGLLGAAYKSYLGDNGAYPPVVHDTERFPDPHHALPPDRLATKAKEIVEHLNEGGFKPSQAVALVGLDPENDVQPEEGFSLDDGFNDEIDLGWEKEGGELVSYVVVRPGAVSYRQGVQPDKLSRWCVQRTTRPVL